MHQDDFKQILNEFEGEECRFANKALDFLDGKQLQHVVNLLNHPNQGRKEWQARGMRASYRNITGRIVEKSGLLFIDGRPDIYVCDKNGDVSDYETEILHAYLSQGDFAIVSENLDQVVRLLKTALVLTQYDSETDQLYFDILHRGNSVVKCYPGTKTIKMLAYKYDIYGSDCGVRVFTDSLIEDWVVDERGQYSLVSQEENTYGHIPATVFYDTKVPRNGFWCNIPKDLVMFNEEYNLYLVDTLFAASYANRKTLFTNAGFNDNQSETLQVQEFYGDPLPRQTNTAGGMIAGPDRQVQIDTTGLDNVFLEYMGPDIKLDEIRQLFEALTRDIAADWSVRVKCEGDGTVNSGFQIIVEEMDNLELRKQRQRMMERGLSSMFNCIASVINTGFNRDEFSPDSEMKVEFAKPFLPVDIKAEDDMWIQRIEHGLASHVDYFMSMKNMSREEAIEAVEQLKEDLSLMDSEGVLFR